MPASYLTFLSPVSKGKSLPGEVLHNKPLHGAATPDFEIVTLELWGFIN